MRARTVSRIAGAASIAVVAFSCSDSGIQQGGVSDECLRLAVYNATDDRCAIQFANQEIMRRKGALTYGKFSATFEKDARVWTVTAAVEPMVPGGQVTILVGRDGEIRDFMPRR